MLIAINRRGYTKFESRLQNSPYFCVFKYARSQAKGLERGWKQWARLGRGFFLSCLTRPTGVWDSYATLYLFFYWFWEKNRLFRSLESLGQKVLNKKNIPSCFITRMKHSTNTHIFQVYLLFLFIGCLWHVEELSWPKAQPGCVPCKQGTQKLVL